MRRVVNIILSHVWSGVEWRGCIQSVVDVDSDAATGVKSSSHARYQLRVRGLREVLAVVSPFT